MPLLDDLRHACRHLRRNPAFAGVLVLTLALGIAATTTMMSLLNALVLRPLPVQDPDALVAASVYDRTGRQILIPTRTVTTLAGRLRTLSSVAAYTGSGTIPTTANGVEESVICEVIGGAYFSILGAQPFLGRLINEEDVPDAGEPAHVVVISHRFWQRRFGGDPDVIGKALHIKRLPLRIIGVTRPGFTGLRVESAPEVVFPLLLMRLLDTPPNPTRTVSAYYMVGRLAPGFSVADAEAELAAVWPSVGVDTLSSRSTADDRANLASQMTSVESIATGFSRLRSRYAAPLQMLFVLAGLLLFITCANLGGLLLARVGSRDRDLTVHAALGASSSRLARQLIAESTLLSVLAAALAVPVAWWLSRAIGSMVWTGTVPLTLDLAPDGRILVFVAGVAVVTGVLIGVLPARHAGRRALAGSPARTATPGTNRIGRALLAGQVALSLALIFPAGLLHRSLQNLEHLDIGFDDRDIGLARTLPLPGGYDNLDLATYYRELHERLEAAPGVEAVGFSRAFPGPTVSAIDMAPAGAPGDATAIDGAMELITPGFFRTIGMRVLDGRAFDWQDDERSRGVVIVNEVLARRLFDNGRAIGRRIRLGAEPHRQDLEIVGVVNDARFGDYRSVPVPMAFRPRWQEPALLRQPVVLVRSRLGSAEAERTLREVVASFRRESLTGTISLETQIDRTMTEDRLMARLSLWLGGMALVLAITGVYAVLAYGFARRRREIGVRLALGARPSGIARIVLRQGLGITLAGIALGVPLALVIGRAMTSLLFGLSPLEPVTLVLVAAACLAAAMLAAAIPALRASRVDPVVVLQAE